MAMRGEIQIRIKISELPKETRTVKFGWQEFFVNAEGQRIVLKVRPRIWRKMQEVNEQFPEWVGSITGKMGHRIKDGFALLKPAVQVYERKVKVPSVKETSETTEETQSNET
jgi:hypothetical protein